MDRITQHLVASQAEHAFGFRVHQNNLSILPAHHHGVRSGLEQRPELLFGLGQHGRLLAKDLRLLAKQSRVPAQLDKHRDFRSQHFGNDGLEEEVDRAEVVTAEQVFIALVPGQKQNRRVPGTRAAADQLGCLEAVHVRHLDIQQHRRELILQQIAQRLGSGIGEDQIFAERIQGGFQGHQILGRIIDQQDLDLLARDGGRFVQRRPWTC